MTCSVRRGGATICWRWRAVSSLGSVAKSGCYFCWVIQCAIAGVAVGMMIVIYHHVILLIIFWSRWRRIPTDLNQVHGHQVDIIPWFHWQVQGGPCFGTLGYRTLNQFTPAAGHVGGIGLQHPDVLVVEVHLSRFVIIEISKQLA